MKRYGGLWEQVVSWDNMLLAARKARRGKRDRAAVQRFEFDLERQLLSLQRRLVDGVYRPGGFTTHWISRPKARLISAAPYRDRVVHHMLMNVLEPILDRHFHPHSYRFWSSHRLIRKSNIRQFRRRVAWMRREYAASRVEWGDIRPRLDSWIGHARQADSERLLRRLGCEWVFFRKPPVGKIPLICVPS